MSYAVTTYAGRVAELHYAERAPEGAVPVSDDDGEMLRRSGRFADYAVSAEGVVTHDPLPGPSATSTVSPWQIRKALNLTGDRSAVEAAVAAADQTTRDGWEFATEFRRNDPLVIAMGAALGKTSEQLDALFELARTL